MWENGETNKRAFGRQRLEEVLLFQRKEEKRGRKGKGEYIRDVFGEEVDGGGGREAVELFVEGALVLAEEVVEEFERDVVGESTRNKDKRRSMDVREGRTKSC